MFGIKRSFLRKFLTLFVLGCVVGIGLIGLHIYKLTSYRVEYGRLNIEDIIDANLLKVIRVDMDYLVDVPLDEGHYTAILPFTVTAEFDLNKIKVIENNSTIKIILPKPQILVDQADDESIKVLRVSGTANYCYIIKGFKIYAENFVKNAAIYNYNILQKANKKVKTVLKSMFDDILAEKKKNLEVITSPVKITERKPVIKVRSEFHPVEINIYDENVKGHVWKDDWNDIFYFENINGVTDNYFEFFRVRPVTIDFPNAESFLKKYNVDYGIFFNSLVPKKRICIKYTNPECLAFFYTFNNWIYKTYIVGANANNFGEALPQFLDLIDNIKFLPNYTPKYHGKDIFGLLTKETWLQKDVRKMKNYFINFYLYSLSPTYYGDKKYSYKYYINPKWNVYKKNKVDNNVYLIIPDSKSLDTEPLVVTDKDGFGWFETDSSLFWKDIHEAIDKAIKDEFKNDIIAVIYNHKKNLHRKRFVFVFKDCIVFYVPERPSLFQDSIWKYYSFEDIKIQGVNGIFDEGCYFIGSKHSKNSEKALESPALCQFLNDFIEYSFPAVFR